MTIIDLLRKAREKEEDVVEVLLYNSGDPAHLVRSPAVRKQTTRYQFLSIVFKYRKQSGTGI